MPYPISLEQQVKQAANLKQTQRLIMSPQMQQAIRLLQMPVLELSAMIEEELQLNPVIECNADQDEEVKSLEDDQAEISDNKDQPPEKELSFDESDFEIMKKLDEEFRDHFQESGSFLYHRSADEEKLKAFQEQSFCAETSLFEFLMKQARETFCSPEELEMAEALIGNFDENGFLKTPLQEVAILNHFSIQKLTDLLKQIQTFEPSGVGALNLQESLLLQLQAQNKQNTLAYKILESHYDDFIHNRIPVLVRKLKCSADEITQALKKDITHLDLHPGFGHFKHFVQYITPDATIDSFDGTLTVQINEDFLPPLRINKLYLRMLKEDSLPSETRAFILQKLAAAKWLLHNVHQRNETLLRIVELLAKVQKEYFLQPNGTLIPMTMKNVAEQLSLHESTIARAVANKYLHSPRGILPLRSFFTHALTSQSGDISSNTIKRVLLELIQSENKQAPLSDSILSKLLNERGIHCARRTIAKYRAELNLGNAQQRKKYSS